MWKAIYLLDEEAHSMIYGAPEREDIARRVQVVAPLLTASTLGTSSVRLDEVELIFSGWGMPRVDGEMLTLFPKLQAIFYGSGSVKGFMTDEAWNRGIRLTSAYAGNGVPVAEFTLAQIIFSLKHGWQAAQEIRRLGKFPKRYNPPGCYGTTVGLLSLGMIGRMVAERLRSLNVKVIAYDPFVAREDAAALGVELKSLPEVFRDSDVVSCHTPWLKETEGLLRGHHFDLMKPGATFINTSRGAVVNEPEMIEVLQRRPDLFALLDVTFPEPPDEGSPLYTIPNVLITPHIAGSMGDECRRMGRIMVEELDLFLTGKPFNYEITREKAAVMA